MDLFLPSLYSFLKISTNQCCSSFRTRDHRKKRWVPTEFKPLSGIQQDNLKDLSLSKMLCLIGITCGSPFYTLPVTDTVVELATSKKKGVPPFFGTFYEYLLNVRGYLAESLLYTNVVVLLCIKMSSSPFCTLPVTDE